MEVICLHLKKYGTPYDESVDRLKKDEIYTVIHNSYYSYLLKEVRSSHPSGEFNSKRFAIVDTTSFEELMEQQFVLV